MSSRNSIRIPSYDSSWTLFLRFEILAESIFRYSNRSPISGFEQNPVSKDVYNLCSWIRIEIGLGIRVDSHFGNWVDSRLGNPFHEIKVESLSLNSSRMSSSEFDYHPVSFSEFRNSRNALSGTRAESILGILVELCLEIRVEYL